MKTQDLRTEKERENGMSCDGLLDFGVRIKKWHVDGEYYCFFRRERMHTEGCKSKMKALKKINAEILKGNWKWLFEADEADE